jgi:L-lactate dehydrogenase complex protein LldG
MVETDPRPGETLVTAARSPATARQEILGRIRAALADRPHPAAAVRDYRRAGRPGTDVVELFAERAADYKAAVERVAPAGLPARIAAVLYDRGVRRLAVPAGLPQDWLTDWLADADVARHGDDPPMAAGDLERLDGVLTGCAVAIAETGTIVLDAGPGQGRRALALLPDFHLCVVAADEIVTTVSEALGRLDPARPQTWISGPSATSDIELDRVEGVHGPRTLHILITAGPEHAPTTGSR